MVPHADVIDLRYDGRHRMAEAADPAQAFAALMSGAGQVADAAADPAPYGYTTDPDGTTRPKKSPGRPRKSPSIEELKAVAAEGMAETLADPPADRPPADGKKSPWAKAKAKGSGNPSPKASEPVPQHRPGVITKGVNKLYRRAGKIVQVMDEDIGKALIAMTKNTADEGEPDDSVGAAWDEVARTNPRIRAWLLRLVAGGAWGQLVMAHAPLFLAIFMKDAVQERLPFVKLLTAFTEPDDDASPAEKANALTEPDMQQMWAMAQGMAAKIAGDMAAGQNGDGQRRAPGAASDRAA